MGSYNLNSSKELSEDRIFTDEDAKTFTKNVEVFIFDTHNVVDYTGCLVTYDSTVPLKNDDGKIIGSAVLSMDHNILVADMFIDYSTPERLNIETGSIPVYPHLEFEPELEVERGSHKATKVHVVGISLSMFQPQDNRIGPV